MKAQCLRTDPPHDVLVSLREALHQIERAPDDPHCWKWAIIAFVCAVGGALACNLNGTMGIGALRNKDRAKIILAHHDPAEPMPNKATLKIDDPLELLERAAEAKRDDPGAGPRIPVTNAQKVAFKAMVDRRNDFVHFKYDGWSLDLGGLPAMFRNALAVMRRLDADGHSFRHLDGPDRADLTETLDRIEQALNRAVRRLRPGGSPFPQKQKRFNIDLLKLRGSNMRREPKPQDAEAPAAPLARLEAAGLDRAEAARRLLAQAAAAVAAREGAAAAVACAVESVDRPGEADRRFPRRAGQINKVAFFRPTTWGKGGDMQSGKGSGATERTFWVAFIVGAAGREVTLHTTETKALAQVRRTLTDLGHEGVDPRDCEKLADLGVVVRIGTVAVDDPESALTA